MIFSGADLIRNSGRQAERAEKLKAAPAAAVKPVENKPALDEETGGALLRFAKFIHGEKDKKKKRDEKPAPKRHGKNPYLVLEERMAADSAKGQSLDIAV